MSTTEQIKIERIVSVVDTREYVEIGDSWKPVPGSGELNTCSRCGRSHEVHATVELSDQTCAIVGTGCMKAESVEITRAIKSLTSAAKSLAKLNAEAAKLEAMITERDRIKEEVAALPTPEVHEVEEEKGTEHGRPYTMYALTAGDVRVSYFDNIPSDERHNGAIRQWKVKREKERGLTYAHDTAKSALIAVQRRIDRLQAKITKG